MLSQLPVPTPLRGFVAAFWTYTGHGQPHRVLPDGCLDFIFNLGSGAATVVGPMSRAIVVPVRAGLESFGVRFGPGHAARFIDADASELLDAQGQLDALTRVACLAERVAEAPSHAARSAIVTQTLLDARARTRAADARVEQALKLITSARGRIAVRGLAASVGLSERQLERRFLERVGLGPKRFARVVRFERAVALGTGLAQATLAAHAGYSDEPHLLRDFRALSGLTPKLLLRELRAERARDVGFVQGGLSGDTLVLAP
jgi:methylphosphotriester-DNA--protein-cysteine methyltransferase